MKAPLFCRRSGAALVITLLFLVIISLLVIGFSETSRVERVSARNHFEQQRATELAQRGLDQVTATLFRETVDPPDLALSPTQIAARSRNWISQPGQLIVPDASALDSGAPSIARKQLSRAVLLHSGAPGGAAPSEPVLVPPDLNIQTLVDQTPPTYLITDRLDTNNRPQPMRVRWVYLRQDGSWDADASDPTLPNENPDLSNTTNPIVGRYAFWADDDSSKINYNLAWKRNAASPGHPSQINLTALTLPDGSSPVSAAMADAIHNFTAATPGAPGSGRQVCPEVFRHPHDAHSRPRGGRQHRQGQVQRRASDPGSLSSEGGLADPAAGIDRQFGEEVLRGGRHD
jgi:hypothetical protein